MPSLQTDYHIGNGDVKLSIIIGEAQIGSSLVKIEAKELARGDEVTDCSLGKGTDLLGKTVIVKTVVNDVNDKTNHTCVTYQLKGGKEDAQFYLEGTVANEGDPMLYRAEFKMI